MQTTHSPALINSSQEAALQNLQTAIVRLASKPPGGPAASSRQDLTTLVEQALEAYREYMKISG